MFCRQHETHIGTNLTDVLTHLFDHVLDLQETMMTAFTDVQGQINSLATELTDAASRIDGQLTVLGGTVDLAPLTAAVATISNIVPAPIPTAPVDVPVADPNIPVIQ